VQAPDFAVGDTKGTTRRLSEFRGKPVVLEWTNADCPLYPQALHQRQHAELRKSWRRKTAWYG
jgi:peroxiredoxin